MSLTYEARFTSIQRYIVAVHGSPRPLTAGELHIVDQFAVAALLDIEDAWPVDTSLSRDSFDYTAYDGGFSPDDPVGFDIENPVWYAEYVHRRGEGPTPLWESLIPNVVQSLATVYLPRLRSEIDATERLWAGGAWFHTIRAVRRRVAVA